jgi:hypothetical protein
MTSRPGLLPAIQIHSKTLMGRKPVQLSHRKGGTGHEQEGSHKWHERVTKVVLKTSTRAQETTGRETRGEKARLHANGDTIEGSERK